VTATINAIVRKHDRFARSIAQRFGGWLMPEHMDDFVQEARLGVAHAATTYDGRAAFRTWAFTCARSYVLAELRRMQRHGFVVKAGPGTAKRRPQPHVPIAPNGCMSGRTDGKYKPGDAPAKAEDEEHDAALVARVLDAVDRLPERYRGVVQARLEGESFVAVADRWGVSHQRVSQVFAQARARVIAEVHA
jgi:RNA polymerase sigma factor (sigma-70 family)